MAERILADLFKAKDITEDDLATAVTGYLEKLSDGAHKVGSASQDIAAAVQAHPYSREMLANADATEGQKRNAVRTAMLLAPVVKAKG